MIYYGEEVGRIGGDWPENRSDMPWGDRNIAPGAGKPRDEALRSDYQRLIKIRREHPALSNGIHTALSSEGDLLVFLQSDSASKDAVVVAINRGATDATAKFKLPEQWPSDSNFLDAWNGKSVSAKDQMIESVLAPQSAAIFVRLTNPQ
jgi:glycosidase